MNVLTIFLNKPACYNGMFLNLLVQISESTPLVSTLYTISSLDTEYNEDAVYSSKIKDLASKYKSIRRTRPDGNCFFRAFAYAYLEYLVHNKEDFTNFAEYIQNSRETLIKFGFPQFTVNDFHETVCIIYLNIVFTQIGILK